MALTDQEIQDLQSQAVNLASARLEDNLNSATQRNPDQVAENIRLSETLNAPYDIVESDPAEARRQKRLQDLSNLNVFETAPKTAQWLTDEKNATLSIDDVETLAEIEKSTIDRGTRAGYWENQARGFLETTSAIGTEGYATAVWASHQLIKPFAQSFDILAKQITGEDPGASEYLQASSDEARRLLDDLEQTSKVYYKFDNRADIQKVLDNPTPATVGEFIAESGPAQIPYMIAAGISLPLITAVVANQVAEQRVQNDLPPDIAKKLAEGKQSNEWRRVNVRLPSDTDMAIGSGIGVLSGLLERFSLSKLIKSGKAPEIVNGIKEGFLRYGIMEVTKGTAREFLTEFAQESLEYAGGSIGTEQGFDIGEMAKQGLAGGLTGAGMGAAVRSVTVYPEYSQKIYEVATKEAINRMESQEAQDWLDTFITLAQGSKTNERSPEQFQEFLDTVDPETHVFLDAGIAAELQNPPKYVTDQLDGTGADVSIKMREFLTDFAKDEERLAFVRPHIKIREDLQTINEIETKVSSKKVEQLIKEAEAKQAARTEADMIYEQVKDQILATRRQGDNTARVSAELIPAYVVATQERLKKQGVDKSIKEIFEDMGFKVVGPGADAKGGDKREMSQIIEEARKYSRNSMYNGADEVPFKHLPEKHKEAFKKAGIVVKDKDGKEIVKFSLLNKKTKRDIVDLLRKCMAG